VRIYNLAIAEPSHSGFNTSIAVRYDQDATSSAISLFFSFLADNETLLLSPSSMELISCLVGKRTPVMYSNRLASSNRYHQK
jgi:hypothetical protein